MLDDQYIISFLKRQLRPLSHSFVHHTDIPKYTRFCLVLGPAERRVFDKNKNKKNKKKENKKYMAKNEHRQGKKITVGTNKKKKKQKTKTKA